MSDFKFGNRFESETREELIAYLKMVKNKKSFGEVVAWLVDFWQAARAEESEMFMSVLGDRKFWEEIIKEDNDDAK